MGGGVMTDCGNVQKVFVPVPDEDSIKSDSKSTQTSSKTSSIGITDLAAKKIIEFVKKDKKSDKEYGLKITVVKDGCSGNSYNMGLSSIEEALSKQDKIIKHNGCTVIIDKLSYIFVIGSTLVYVESLLMSGFQLVNPNVKGSCSCGSSFKV